jgi:hypothetical protein
MRAARHSPYSQSQKCPGQTGGLGSAAGPTGGAGGATAVSPRSSAEHRFHAMPANVCMIQEALPVNQPTDCDTQALDSQYCTNLLPSKDLISSLNTMHPMQS